MNNNVVIFNLEKEIGKKLEKCKKLTWNSVGYILDENESVVGISLYKCDLKTIPSSVFQLKSLQTLDLSFNQLSELPKEIAELKSLQKLYLSSNQLSELPKEIAELKSLHVLDLSSNQLSELPKEIAELPMKIKWESADYSDGINLYDNPLKHPPIEIIKQGRKNVLNYFKSIEKETIKLFEAKLLIVGEGGVGKTCLMKRIVHQHVSDEDLSTEGIDIQEWIIKTELTNHFRINFWDFGGQEIYHATHQFFLTKRSLYILVWEARKDDDLTGFDYWLNVIRLLSDHAPVLIVLNKIDMRIKPIQEQYLQQSFKNIVGFHKVSATENLGIDALVKDIIDNITKLDHIGDTLPKVWVDIRKKLEALNENFIAYDRYLSICNTFELTQKEADFLSLYFHDLGVFLHFKDNAILSDIIFLKPEWATNAVYKIIDTKEVQHNHGIFHYDELRTIWDNYPPEHYIRLIELMKKFEICFQIPNQKTYIVPVLLPADKASFEWNDSNNLRFEYYYPFMPAGIISRFIVRTHNYIKDELYWQNGLVLQRNDTKAFITSDRLGRKISIRICGSEKKELLYYIRGEIDYIHQTLNNPEKDEMIPCICSECINHKEPYFYKYLILKKFQLKGKATIPCEKSVEDVSVESLLGGIEIRHFESKNSKIINNTIYGDYYEKGDKDMHIHNLNAKRGSQVNIADKINKISYSEDLGINEDEWRELSQSIKALDPNQRMELKQQFDIMNLTDSDKDKASKMRNIIARLKEHGIAISQSLTATGIFEMGRLLL